MYSNKTLFIDDRIKKIRSCGIDSLRLEFTNENKSEVINMIKLHQGILNYEEESPIKRPKNATTGHFIKGVE